MSNTLWDGADAKQEPQPTPDLDRLLLYSRAVMKYQGEHDLARRAQLRAWSQEHGYPERWYTEHDWFSGYRKRGMPKGEEGWTHFLKVAVQFDVYCLYVAIFAPEPLEHYLDDAAARGEIRLSR